MGSPATMESIKNKSVPKGDVFEMAKAAALFAIKRTSDVIPDCHPLPIEFAAVHYFPEEMELKIEVEVKPYIKQELRLRPCMEHPLLRSRPTIC